MKQKKLVSMICALVLIISAVVLISGCPQRSKPILTLQTEIEGIPWECIYTKSTSWESIVLTLNGTTASFKAPGEVAFTIPCVIDKANKKVKLVFHDGTAEYDYVIKENGTILEFLMDGVLVHKFKKM